MSTALAVRMRPRTFEHVAGQHHVVEVLRAAAARRPVPQQILLAGPSGVGKTTLARIFAAGLFCGGAVNGSPCGRCSVCAEVTGPGGRHPDVIELDAASHGGIEQIRALADEAHLAPLKASHKVYIIDEAHGLTRDGAQAFLRLLEEPPSHTVFVLATTDPEKLPDALRGRCLLCYATPVDRDEKVANLGRICAEEGWPVPVAVLEVVVDGTDAALGVRGTVTNLDKVAAATSGAVDAATAAALLGVADPALLGRLTGAIVAGDRAGALGALLSIVAIAPRSVVHAQLTGFAHAQLRAAATSGGRVEMAVWWLTQLAAHRAEHLEVAVAKMADPHLGGHGALAALVERAEAAAAALSAAPPVARDAAPVATAAPVANPTAAPPAATPAATPAASPAAAPRVAAPRPVVEPAPPAWVEVPAGDPRRVAWTNAVSGIDAVCALALSRAAVQHHGSMWHVSAPNAADRGRLEAALTSALSLTHPGHTVTLG